MNDITQFRTITLNFKEPWNAKTHYLILRGDEKAQTGFSVYMGEESVYTSTPKEDFSLAQEILKKYKL
jgi:hypothetical protein